MPSGHAAQGLIKNPSHALVFSLLTTVLDALISVTNWNLLRELPAQPEAIDILVLKDSYQARAERPFWVSLQNSKWDCNSIRSSSSVRNKKTEIIATSLDERIIVLVDFSDILTCDEIAQTSPVGFVTQMSERRYKLLIESGEFDLSRYKDSNQYFDLCAYCGRNNTIAGLIAGAIFTIVGLLFYPLYRRSYYNRYRRIKKYVPAKTS